MNVDYWRVGQAHPTLLPLSRTQLVAHIAADWSPNFPPIAAVPLFRWVDWHLEDRTTNGITRLSISQSARYLEPQWKTSLSWLVGVGGARAVLRSERYAWVAPLSAFYRTTSAVAIPDNWPAFWRPGNLRSRHRRGNRPDFLALRLSPNGSWEFTIAEAKGGKQALNNRVVCRADWRRQVQNASLHYQTTTIPIHRRMVVATRANPGGSSPVSRAIQLRAWNEAAITEVSHPPPGVVAEVAAAHVFGLFGALGLIDSALAIAAAVSGWGRQTKGGSDREGVNARAEHELDERFQPCREVPLAPELLKLASLIRNSHSPEPVDQRLTQLARLWINEDREPPTGIAPPAEPE